MFKGQQERGSAWVWDGQVHLTVHREIWMFWLFFLRFAENHKKRKREKPNYMLHLPPGRIYFIYFFIAQKLTWVFSNLPLSGSEPVKSVLSQFLTTHLQQECKTELELQYQTRWDGGFLNTPNRKKRKKNDWTVGFFCFFFIRFACCLVIWLHLDCVFQFLKAGTFARKNPFQITRAVIS